MDKGHLDQEQKNKPQHKQVFALILIVLVLFVGMAIILSNFYRPYFSSDFFTFWLAGRLTLLGQDPYSEAQWLAGHSQYHATWAPNSIFPYPLPLALLLTPLGLFSQKTAYVIWLVITNIFVTSSIFLISRTWLKWNSALVLSICVSAFFFRPYITVILGGQLLGLFLFVVSLSLYLWYQEKWFLGGMLMGLLNLKPSYGALLLILIGVWLLRIRQNRAIAGIIVSNIILGVVGFLQNPQWVQLFFATGQRKFAATFGLYPTVWSVGNLLCKGNNVCQGWVVGGVVAFFLLLYLHIIFIRRLDRSDTNMIVSLAIPLALLLTYSWAYDQVLLIVSITFITGRLFQFPLRIKFLPWVFPFFIDIFAIILLLWARSLGTDMWSLLLPTFIAAIILLFIFVSRENLTLDTKNFSEELS